MDLPELKQLIAEQDNVLKNEYQKYEHVFGKPVAEHKLKLPIKAHEIIHKLYKIIEPFVDSRTPSVNETSRNGHVASETNRPNQNEIESQMVNRVEIATTSANALQNDDVAMDDSAYSPKRAMRYEGQQDSIAGSSSISQISRDISPSVSDEEREYSSDEPANANQKKNEPQEKRRRMSENANNVRDKREPRLVKSQTETQLIRKNNQRSVHSQDKFYSQRCIYCSVHQSNLVKHLKEKHPNKEVYISRPPPNIANRMRMDSVNRERNEGNCAFCGITLTARLWHLKQHMVKHTGEGLFYCEKCKTSMDKASHSGCSQKRATNIFELNANNAMRGFICNICNYIQIQKHRIIQHLVTEHNEIETSNQYQQVNLLLNSNNMVDDPIDNQSQYVFVDEMHRYTCGIEECRSYYHNANQLKTHFIFKHRRNNEFTCAHCETVITWQSNSAVPAEKLIAHLKLHGNELYDCTLCERSFSEEAAAITHMYNDHPDDALILNYYHRKLAANTVAYNIHVKFQCALCDIQFDNYNTVSDHYDAFHYDRNIDLQVKVIKQSLNASTQRLQLGETNWCLRELFTCAACDDFELHNKLDIIEHFKNVHPNEIIELKLEHMFLLPMEDCRPTNRDEKFDRLLFCCEHCTKGCIPTEYFAEVEDVYAHWLLKHKNCEFRFQVAGLAVCHHCDTISTYFELKKHHVEHHDGVSLCLTTIANRKKCALCHFGGGSDEMINHFQSQHNVVIASQAFSPFCLTNKILDDLLGLAPCKRYRCFHCGFIAESLPAIKEHSTHAHKTLPPKYTDITDATDTVILAVCCKKLIKQNHYIEHIKSHYYEFECSSCDLRSADMHTMIKHDVMEHHRGVDSSFKRRQQSLYIALLKLNHCSIVFFGNGLTLSKGSLNGTDLDDTAALCAYVDETMRIARENFVVVESNQHPVAFIDIE